MDYSGKLCPWLALVLKIGTVYTQAHQAVVCADRLCDSYDAVLVHVKHPWHGVAQQC